MNRWGVAVLLAALRAWAAEEPSTYRFDTARALYQAAQYEAALKQLEASEQAAEPAPDRPLYRAMTLAGLGRWAECRRLLEPLTKEQSGHPDAWYWLGASQYYTKSYAAAESSLDRALQLRPQDADAYRMRGLVRLQLNRWNDGYQDWLQAARLNPRDEKTRYYLGRLFQEAGQLEQAKTWLQAALQIAPEQVEALTYLGLTEEGLGHLPVAAGLYRRAVEISVAHRQPFSWAFLCLGQLQQKQGEPTAARQTLERGATLTPEPQLLYTLAKLLLTTEEKDRAEQLLRQAIAQAPGLSQAHYQLGRLLAAKGQQEEATREMELFQQTKATESAAPRVRVQVHAAPPP